MSSVRPGRRLVRFALHPGRLRTPRGWVGLFVILAYLMGVMMYASLWLCVVMLQVMWWGVVAVCVGLAPLAAPLRTKIKHAVTEERPRG